MATVCHLWPAVAPHGPEVPTSIWNLPYGVWVGLAASADHWIEQNKQNGG